MSGTLPQKDKTKEYGQVFLNNPSVNNNTEGKNDEDIIAENIFDWWISGKSYKKWYAEKFLQIKIDFDDKDK